MSIFGNLLIGAGVVALMLLVASLTGAYLRTRSAPLPKKRPLEAGDRVRFLCAIPELGIQAGECGRVYLVYPGDDLQWFVAPDHDSSQRVIFFENELWQIERVSK